MEYYYDVNHENIGVLCSFGFGAGFSTWNDPNLASDKRVVEYWIRNREYMPEERVKKYLESIGYYNVYMGGWDTIDIVWVPIGSYWRIEEYDGAERVEILNTDDWNYAK